MNAIRPFALLLFFFCASLNAQSQSLEGLWEGSFGIDGLPYRFPIWLNVRLNIDSTYGIESFCVAQNDEMKIDTVICKVSFKQGNRLSMYFEETDIIRSTTSDRSCMQKMKLHFRERKEGLMLEGWWEHVDRRCGRGGNISFAKVKL